MIAKIGRDTSGGRRVGTGGTLYVLRGEVLRAIQGDQMLLIECLKGRQVANTGNNNSGDSGSNKLRI